MRCKDNFYYLCKRKEIMKRILFSVLLPVLILSGCSLNDYKKLKFKSYDVASVTDFAYAKAAVSACVELDLSIENPTSSKFELLSLDASLYTEKGTKFADATSARAVMIPAHSDDVFPLFLNATIYNPLVVALSQKVDYSTMTADIDALVRMGRIEKRIKKEKVAVKALLEAAGYVQLKLN